nr:calmodulin-binding peptide-FLAG epitope fusion protein [Cloning vector pCALnFLAG]
MKRRWKKNFIAVSAANRFKKISSSGALLVPRGSDYKDDDDKGRGSEFSSRVLFHGSTRAQA